MRIIGDIHGDFGAYHEIIHDVDKSIQVGDFGMGFGPIPAEVELKMDSGNHKFIRGNHDDPAMCRQSRFCIPDGTMHEGFFCIGGALSIDREYRTEGVNWWRDEELSYAEWNIVYDTYARLKPEYVITHDLPESVTNVYCALRGIGKFNDPSITQRALDQMLALHKPKVWLCGHWHTTLDFMWDGVRYIVIGINDWCDVEI
jgi:hypothetical protein